MGIPVIREVAYTDDGCTEYQCLSCKEILESRSSPVRKKTGGYTFLWKFCPYCGIKFKEFMPESQSSEKQYYDNPKARTDRLYPCLFIIDERFIDGENIGEWKEDYHHQGNPVYILKKYKKKLADEKLFQSQFKKDSNCYYEYRIRKV